MESDEDTYQPYEHVDDFFLFDYQSIVDHVPQRFPDSCCWILEAEPFSKWCRGDGSTVLWLHGYPGQGKSVIAKYLVEEVLPRISNTFLPSKWRQLTVKPIVAYFFCSYRSSEARTLTGLLCSVIHQLLSQLPHTRRLKQTMRMRHTALSQPPNEVLRHLWTIFRDLVTERSLCCERAPGNPKRVKTVKDLYLVLDALDELDRSDRTLFLERFRGISRQSLAAASTFKIIITSRDDPDIATFMQGVGAWSVNLDTAQGNETDLAKYVTETVSMYGQDNRFGESLSQSIISELLARANGMFLWASLAWAFFTDGVGVWTKKTIRERLQVLQLLPPGMEALYQRILDEVDPKYRDDLLHSLQIIVSASNPLHVDEIAIALALRDRPRKLCDIDARLNMHAFFRRACPHLIKIDQAGMISLIHLSCKDYLGEVRMIGNRPNTFHIDMAAANLEVGLDCISYVGLDDFANRSLEDACEQNRFLMYAYLHWYHHLRDRSDRAQEIWSYFSRLFDHNMGCFRWYDNSELVIVMWNHGLDGLFALAANPPFHLDLNVTDGHGDHFIHIVVTDIRRFPLDRVKFLTGLGLDINGRTRFGQTLLHRCIREWQDEQDSFLQEKSENLGKAIRKPSISERTLHDLLSFPGVDPNAMDVFGYTPLSFAIYEGLDKVVAILLSYPELNFNDGSAALHIAAKEGVLPAVKALLGRGVSTREKTRDGETALHFAARKGHFRVLELLASQSPVHVLNAKDNNGWTIAHRAITSGNDEMFLWLTKHSLIDLGLRDKHGRRPVAFAAAYGTLAMLKGVLDSRPHDVSHADSFGNTLFHMAASGGSIQNFSYLLELVEKGRIARPGANSWGRTVVDLAPTQGMAAYLRELGFDHSVEYMAFQNELAFYNIQQKLRAATFPNTASCERALMVGVASPEQQTALNNQQGQASRPVVSSRDDLGRRFNTIYAIDDP
jgi:ankyrin repeat protein